MKKKKVILERPDLKPPDGKEIHVTPNPPAVFEGSGCKIINIKGKDFTIEFPNGKHTTHNEDVIAALEARNYKRIM